MDPNHNTAPEVLAERKRVAFITSAGAKHARAGIDADFTRDLIERGVPLEACRAAVLERLAAYSDSLPPFSTPPAMERNMMLDADGHARELPPTRPAITPGNDAGEDFRRAAIDSIMLRTGIEVKKPHAAAGDVSSSVHDLARICLSRAGKSSSRIFGGEARGLDLIKRAMTTSDFPNILSGALHATIRRGYEEEPATHRAWVRVVPVPDFRDQERPILGSAPSLDVVLEHAEYTHGYLTDDKTSYRVEKFGKIVALSWEVLVNDNLSAFLRLQPVLGQAARRKEADLVYAILAANPVMQDGVALFHTATHGNMTSSAAFDATQLSAGRTLLRKQTALGGGYLALAPRYLIVPVEKETAAETLLANATRRATSEKVTPEWISNLQLVVEPRLASTAVYLASDPNQIDTVELGLLEENASGPIIEEEREFGKDIFSWKVRHVCGAKALDWRGLVKMPVT